MLSLGIDLSTSSKRPSTLAFLDASGSLVQLSAFRQYRDLIPFLEENNPDIIAIDAPLGLPLGLDCLEEDCPCASSNGHKGRMGEVELAQMGIGCFYTGKRSIIKKLIYRGVKLRTSLTQLGFQVIEVYPYATKVLIFGDSLPPKSKPEGLVYLRQHLPKLVPGLEDHVGGLNHKGCDAVLSAYTAYLHINGKTDSLGMPEEGTIAVPSLPK